MPTAVLGCFIERNDGKTWSWKYVCPHCGHIYGGRFGQVPRGTGMKVQQGTTRCPKCGKQHKWIMQM